MKICSASIASGNHNLINYDIIAVLITGIGLLYFNNVTVCDRQSQSVVKLNKGVSFFAADCLSVSFYEFLHKTERFQFYLLALLGQSFCLLLITYHLAVPHTSYIIYSGL